jgi:hypothetical protein
MSSTFTVQKCGDDPFQMTFSKDNKVSWIGIYNDPDKIGLYSAIGADEVFTASVPVVNIKPFASSNIGEEIIVAAHMTKKMSFTTSLDKMDDGTYACSVKMYTDLGNGIALN